MDRLQTSKDTESLETRPLAIRHCCEGDTGREPLGQTGILQRLQNWKYGERALRYYQ